MYKKRKKKTHRRGVSLPLRHDAEALDSPAGSIFFLPEDQPQPTRPNSGLDLDRVSIHLHERQREQEQKESTLSYH